MTVHVGFSQDLDSYKAAEDIKSSFGEINPVLVVFFASTVYNPDEISSAMKEVFPNATVLGCSSSGELVSGHLLKKSIVSMAFEADKVKTAFADIIRHEDGSIDETFKSISARYHVSPLDLNPAKYVGMVLFDGLSGTEERSMERLGDLTNISIVGGSAGDDLAFSKTYVYLDGKAYTKANIFAVIEPAVEFEVLKTQSFKAFGKKLTPTKVDAASRKVLEFNGKPAAQTYADALGVTISELTNQFMKHPLGLMDGEEPYVRSPQRIENEAVYFYCQILEGIELEILTSTDIISDTRKTIQDRHEKEPISALINFHCILRTLQLEAEKKTNEYGEIFSEIPTVGFSTYGEEYIGHINQTSTMLAFH